MLSQAADKKIQPFDVHLSKTFERFLASACKLYDSSSYCSELISHCIIAASRRVDLTRRNTRVHHPIPRPTKTRISEYLRLSLSHPGGGHGRHTRDTASYFLSRSRQVNSALKFFSHRKRFLATFVRQLYIPPRVLHAARKFISRTRTNLSRADESRLGEEIERSTSRRFLLLDIYFSSLRGWVYIQNGLL